MYTHTSQEHISIGYEDTFYEECVSVILYEILCCFMLFYVERFKFVYSPPEDECIHSKQVEVLKLYIYIYIYIYTHTHTHTYIHTYYLIVVCVDSKKYITDNEPQRDTEVSIDTEISISEINICRNKVHPQLVGVYSEHLLN
jgi:hypothetical protein